MGQRPLIDEDTSRSTHMPTDLDDSSFEPTSTFMIVAKDDAGPGQNLTYFVAKCR
jgi:hypothetical protein